MQVRAPGSRVAKKKPIKMTRHPVPPRVPDPMANKDKKEMAKVLAKCNSQKRNNIWPETFVQAQAKQLHIMPPHFQEKHLKTKTNKKEDFAITSPVKTLTTGHTEETQKSEAVLIQHKAKHEQSTQSSVHKSDNRINTDERYQDQASQSIRQASGVNGASHSARESFN